MPLYIYILELSEKKKYVGLVKHGDPFKRIKGHYKSSGARFTQKFKVNKLLHVEEVHDAMDELKFTLQHMDTYRISNVRGDIYVQENISGEEYRQISERLAVASRCHGSTLYVMKFLDNFVISFSLKAKVKPCIIFKVQVTDGLDIYKVTYRYIEKFGLENVRGDAIPEHFNQEERKAVIKQLRHANQQCLRCGSTEHYIKSCPHTTCTNLCPRNERYLSIAFSEQEHIDFLNKLVGNQETEVLRSKWFWVRQLMFGNRCI